MMKKIGLSVFTFMMTVYFQQSIPNVSELMIKPKEDLVPIYENRGGTLSEIGKMRIDEPLIVNKDYSANWWQVKFGNGFGYVNKDLVGAIRNVNVLVRNNRENSNTVILIHKDIDVYDNSSGGLKAFAVLKTGYRYPVLSSFGDWWEVDVGGRVGFIHKQDTTVDKGVPILMYHHILTQEEKADSPFAALDTTITNAEFNEQMDFLKENGFTTISTKELEEYLNRELNIPAKSVVLTIDDGNISSRIYAYPKLQQHGFVADQFIITERTPEIPEPFDHKNLHFLSNQEMEEMADVYSYMSHTHALHSLTDANESFVIAKERDEVKQDLLLNRELLNNTRHFAYPFGQYNEDTLQIVREAGFTTAYTTKPGRATLGVNKFLIPREGIVPNLPITEFAKTVNN